MKIHSQTRFPEYWLRGARVFSGLVLLTAALLVLRQGVDCFVTPDQRGQSLMNAGKFAEAAETFVDPFRQAVALYRAGEFEDAASLFGGLPSAEASYNQANAQVMLGRYDDAVSQYDRALQLRPDWDAAAANREIAMGRAGRMDFEGGDMTGGQMGADDFTFDQDASATEQTEMVDGGPEPNDEALRAIWLRQVQTTPGDFLRAKFAYQRAMAAKPEGGKDE